MRISIRAHIETDGDRSIEPVTVGVIERSGEGDPAAGLGLFLREGRELLKQIQAVGLDLQVDDFIGFAARCLACGKPLGIKDTKSLVYRTAFSKSSIRSPRFYPRCSACGFRSGDEATVSPLAKALSSRVHPQWAWLQCRYASVMSYGLAKKFLRDAFAGGNSLPTSSIKRNVQAVGERLEHEARVATMAAAHNFSPSQRLPLTGPPLSLQIDAGYIRSTDSEGGKAWMPVIASKLVPPRRQRGYAHAYVGRLDANPGMRQQAFLQSLGVSRQSPITVLSDGGDDVSRACRLPTATTRVLDWFHVGMRFEQLQLSIRGLKGLDPYIRRVLQQRVVSANRLLWHGNRNACLAILEALRRETGWVGAHNVLGRLIRYLRSCAKMLVNYAQRRARGLPISSAGAESAVDYVIGQRMKRNGHMRWTRRGANALLQVRCAVLNGTDIRTFMRWHPPGARFGPLPAGLRPS